jgi:hypothetical protein
MAAMVSPWLKPAQKPYVQTRRRQVGEFLQIVDVDLIIGVDKGDWVGLASSRSKM